jgi:hypothetical protein
MLHVQAISNQCDRAKPKASNNLRDHHCGADGYDGPGFSFVPLMRVTKKNVRMTKIVNRTGMHVLLHGANGLYI